MIFIKNGNEPANEPKITSSAFKLNWRQGGSLEGLGAAFRRRRAAPRWGAPLLSARAHSRRRYIQRLFARAPDAKSRARARARHSCRKF